MSHTRTQRHTKLAQYVIQAKNTVRSRHFAPRMRVSKGIKDSKASFARRAQNGQPPSPLSSSSPARILLLFSNQSLYLRVALPLYHPPCTPTREKSIERALKTSRFEAAAAGTRPHSGRTEIRTNRCTMPRRARGANALRRGA